MILVGTMCKVLAMNIFGYKFLDAWPHKEHMECYIGSNVQVLEEYTNTADASGNHAVRCQCNDGHTWYFNTSFLEPIKQEMPKPKVKYTVQQTHVVLI